LDRLANKVSVKKSSFNIVLSQSLPSGVAKIKAMGSAPKTTTKLLLKYMIKLKHTKVATRNDLKHESFWTWKAVTDPMVLIWATASQ
jgi:hypothetical protein